MDYISLNVDDLKHDTDKALNDIMLPDEPFYFESNMRYLKGIMHDVKNGKSNFAEHDLIETD